MHDGSHVHQPNNSFNREAPAAADDERSGDSFEIDTERVIEPLLDTLDVFHVDDGRATNADEILRRKPLLPFFHRFKCEPLDAVHELNLGVISGGSSTIKAFNGYFIGISIVGSDFQLDVNPSIFYRSSKCMPDREGIFQPLPNVVQPGSCAQAIIITLCAGRNPMPGVAHHHTQPIVTRRVGDTNLQRK